MSPRGIRSAVVGSLIIAGSIALGAGCGDDEDELASVLPVVPPKIRITAIRTTSGKSFEVGSGDPAVVEAGCDPQQTLGLELVIEAVQPVESFDFLLRPPGACGGIAQCGMVLVTVDGPGDKDLAVSSASLSTPIQLSKLPFEPGEYVFLVELRDGAGQPLAIPEAVTSDSLTINILAPTSCGPKDGGSDASDAAENDAADGGGDAEPDVSSDAAFDAVPDALDAGTETDSPADVAEDQG